MGPQRLIRSKLFGLVLPVPVLVLAAVGALGCAGPTEAPAKVPAPQPPHLQIVYAMKTPERRALVARFRERNDEGDGSAWTINEEALGMSVTVIDPFVGFLRRARRRPIPRAKPSRPLADGDARAIARAFVRRNADLLGLPRHLVIGLGERVRNVEPADHASPNAVYAVRFDAPFATKGYEAFHEIDNTADLEVFVDDDGQVSSFVNLSRVHPRLMLDTRPRLTQDDPRLVSRLVGRSVFALLDHGLAPLDPSRVPRDVRELHRIPLGTVNASDVAHVQLVIHESTGPELAWLTYRLAYFVEVAKPAPPALGEASLAPIFFFRYVVDADTGEILEDARAPVTSPEIGD